DPNPPEADLARTLGDDMVEIPGRRALVLLPAGTDPARRFLRALINGAPAMRRSLVAASGDAIAFNDIFRDRDLASDIRALPVPLVLFTHQAPTGAWEKRGGQPPTPYSSAEDQILAEQVIPSLALAAFPEEGQRTLVADADELKEQLLPRRGRLFRPT